MVILNGQQQEITLIGCDSSSEIPSLVVKEHGVATLLSDQKKIFIFFDSKNPPCKYTLKRVLHSFFKSNTFSLNVDVKSFQKYAKCPTFRTVIETSFYYDFHPYQLKTTKPKSERPTINIIYHDRLAGGCDLKFLKKEPQKEPWTAEELFLATRIKTKSIALANKLTDMPPNVCYPEFMADIIAVEAGKIPSINIKILKKEEIVQQNMNLLLSVNAGSARDPRVVILEYRGGQENEKTIAIVGKGVTFDTGGYNLKPSQYMVGMKYDMTGAAIALTTLIAIAEAGLKVNVCAIGCLVRNAIGANGTIPESVIKSKNGKTVQIDNTDAEGRLIVADGITYAIREIGNIGQIIELSTLTGAIIVALGTTLTGVFATDDDMYCRFAQAAGRAQEEI